MKELREVLSVIGLQQVRTYIQSDNAVFQTQAVSKDQLASAISAAIQQSHGFASDVCVLSIHELRSAIANNPFASRSDDPKSVHLYFLAREPGQDGLAKVAALAQASEDYQLLDSVFDLYAPKGVGHSQLAKNAEKALGVSATARNLRPAHKILALAETRVP